jgi:hypothetical protein
MLSKSKPEIAASFPELPSNLQKEGGL